MKRIIIVGLGSAGYAALTTIKRINPKADITVIDPKEYDLMHPCGLPYSLEGMLSSDRLYQDINLSRMNVKKIQDSIISIDPSMKIVECSQKGKSEYDSLILALGNKPVIPPIEGISELLGKSIFTLTNVEDLLQIQKTRDGKSSVIVIGAGAIGLETALALKPFIDDVTIIEMQNQVLPGILDKDISEVVEEYCRNQGIKLVTGVVVSSVSEKNTLLFDTSDGEYEAELGILATGFKANYDLAEKCGVECSVNGIVVNSKLETSQKDIYGAGDCISGWSIIDGSILPAKLATSAYKHGIIAAYNVMGHEKEYRGSAGTFVTKIGDLEVSGTGFSTAIAKEKGFRSQQGKIKAGVLPEYFPDNKEVTIKVIFDSNTGTVLGGQAVGVTGAAERINILSTAIEYGVAIDRLQSLELAYCPAVSEVYDPLLRAVDFGLRRMKRK